MYPYAVRTGSFENASLLHHSRTPRLSEIWAHLPSPIRAIRKGDSSCSSLVECHCVPPLVTDPSTRIVPCLQQKHAPLFCKWSIVRCRKDAFKNRPIYELQTSWTTGQILFSLSLNTISAISTQTCNPGHERRH
jgi:hypothetical protein